MKIKILSVALLAGVLMFTSCEKNPQKEAQKEAKKEQRKADFHEDMADNGVGNEDKNRDLALKYQTKADIASAIGSVNVPSFQNVTANEFVKKVGNDISALAQSEDYEEAGKYVDHLDADMNELEKKVSKGSISQQDALQIANYVTGLASALGVPVETYEVDVEVETVPTDSTAAN